MPAAGRYFYLKRIPGAAAAALYVREGLAGREKLLIDPARLANGTRRATIAWISPSPDARHVAYGVALAGSSDVTLRVLDVQRGTDLPFEIDRARFNAQLAWHPAGASFYYARIPETEPRYASIRVYRHVLGRETARDEVVFASGVGGARGVPEYALPWIVVPRESRFAYAVTQAGRERELAVHVTELRDLEAGRPKWHRITSFEDRVSAIEAWRDDVYLVVHRDTPRGRVVVVNARKPELAAARLVVPQGDSVIESLALARDALYLRTMVGGVDRLERMPLGVLGRHETQYVRTPFDTSITRLIADPRHPGAVLQLEGWLDPPVVVQIDAGGNMHETSLQPRAPLDLGALDDVLLYATAKDGVKIAITLVYRKSTQLNGSNPTLLVSYGSFGVSLAPSFDATRLAWLERGGVLAFAHVRGGGEYGEAWHEAAMGARKATSVSDLVAVAEFLESYGFTSPRRLALMATEAGGIAAGGAAVRRPDLFCALVARAPLMDMLRFEAMPAGRFDVPEFGSAATPEGAQALGELSPYHQVKPQGEYPAALFLAPAGDWRVPAWQPAKMAARLQAATASGKPVLLRIDDASAYASARAERAAEMADIYAFLLWQMGDPAFQPPAYDPTLISVNPRP